MAGGFQVEKLFSLESIATGLFEFLKVLWDQGEDLTLCKVISVNRTVIFPVVFLEEGTAD